MKLETVGFLLAATAFVLLNVDVIPGSRTLGFVFFLVACGVFAFVRFGRRGRTEDHE